MEKPKRKYYRRSEWIYPLCPKCKGKMKPSSLEFDKWICKLCNKVVIKNG